MMASRTPMLTLLLFMLLLILPPSSWPSAFDTTNICNVSKVIKFLNPISLSGGNMQSGIQVRDGLRAAFNQFNVMNPIGKVRLVVDAMDDVHIPDISEAIVRNYTVANYSSDDQYFAVIGTTGTDVAKQSIPICVERGVPYIGGKTGAMLLRQPFQPLVINFRASYVDEAAMIVEYLLKNGRQRIAIFIQNDSFGADAVWGVQAALNSSNMYIHSITRVTADVVDPQLDVEVTNAIRILNSTGDYPPDAVVMACVANPATRLIYYAQKLWPDMMFAGLSSVVPDQLVKKMFVQGGADMIRNTIAVQPVPLVFDKSVPIVAQYHAANALMNPPLSASINGLEAYLVARMTIDALERTKGVFTREAFIAALYGNGFVDLPGLRCGPFNPASADGGCNQCMHRVTLVRLLPDQTVVFANPSNPHQTFSTCGYQPRLWQRLTFGQSCTFSGPNSVNCAAFRDGLLAAFREVNDAGGVRGSVKLELVTRDDHGEGATAVANVRRLLNDSDVFGLVGISGLGIESVVDDIAAANKPMLGAFSGSRKLRSPFNEFIVNLRASQADELAAMVTYCFYKLKHRRISIVYQQNSTSALAGRSELIEKMDAFRLRLHSEASFATKQQDTAASVARTVVSMPKQPPQSVIVMGETDLAVDLWAFLADSHPDIVVFGQSNANISSVASVLATSVTNNASGTSSNTNLNPKSFVLAQVVPLLTDESVQATTRYRQALRTYDQYSIPNAAGFEGYTTGHVVAVSVQRVPGDHLTTQSVLNTIFDSGSFNVNGLRCGPLVAAINDTTGYVNGDQSCNQCMKRVWLASPAPISNDPNGTTPATTIAGTVPFEYVGHDFSFATCGHTPTPSLDFQLSGMRLIMLIVTHIGMAYVVVLMVLLIMLRHHKPIRGAFKFTMVSCVGAIGMFASVGLLYGIPTDFTCALEPWVADLCFVTLFGPVFVKTQRIDMIFNNKKITKIIIKDSQVIKNFVILTCSFVAFLIVWTVLSKRHMVEKHTENGLRYESCESPIRAFQYIDYALKAVLLLWGCVLCQRVRKISGQFTAFNESSQIAISIYNTSFFGVIALLFTFVLNDPNIYYVSFTSLLIINTVIAVTILFALPIYTAKHTANNASDKSDKSSKYQVGSGKTGGASGTDDESVNDKTNSEHTGGNSANTTSTCEKKPKNQLSALPANKAHIVPATKAAE